MQDYIDLAKKNGIVLIDKGKCQFCGAETKRGIHECIEIFSLGFQLINYSKAENHIYRFISVDAHTLEHSEIHGRWNNHFHLTRLHLIFNYKIDWKYELSSKLSDCLNKYKAINNSEYLNPPPLADRGAISTTDILSFSKNEIECKQMIINWGLKVYHSWQNHHSVINKIAIDFIKKNNSILQQSRQI